MTDDKAQETQQELFPDFPTAAKKGHERYPALARSHKPILISTTLEQLLMITIVLILILCGIFFLGVLRGKSLSPWMPGPSAVPMHAPLPQPPPTVTPHAEIAPKGLAVQAPAKKGLITPSMTPVSERPYTIQLVTHRKKENAENEASDIRKMGYPSAVISSGEYFLVCAGQYANKAEAKRDLVFFSSKYKDCFLRRR